MLEVKVADRAEDLLEDLVGVLAVPPRDPFTPDWVAVASIGMRRWLTQRLSERLGSSGRGDGVTANVKMPFPAELRARVLAGTAPGSGAARPSTGAAAWDPDRLVWAVLAVLSDPAIRADRLLGPLARVGGGATLAGRALPVADLFDRYMRHRPSMVRDWLAGRDVDGAGAPLGDNHRWQPVLMRALRDHVGTDSPAERLPAVLEDLRKGALAVELPQRLVMFGLSTLPPDLVELIQALAEHRDVHLLATTPSTDLARRVVAALSGSAAGGEARSRKGSQHLPDSLPDSMPESLSQSLPLRSEHPLTEHVSHPLLRSWGGPSRETAALLGISGLNPATVARPGGQAADDAQTLLARLQADIRSDRAPDGSHVLRPGDRSVQVHACTGTTRQVEVLRDALLHLFAEDPELTEADVAVLCPRMEEFSPVIQAVLGPSATAETASADGSPRPPQDLTVPSLRYRITDRTVRSEVPLLGAVAALLELVPGRFSASAVADFLGLGPVRDRFGLTMDDLSRLDSWIEGTRTRWGLDGRHRSGWGMPVEFEANSWSAAVDQLMLGTVIRAEPTTLGPGGVAPLAVGEGQVVLAARIAEAVRHLARARDELTGPLTVAEWADAVRRCMDHLCSLPPSEAWQRRRLDRVLEELVDSAAEGAGHGDGAGNGGLQLGLADLRRMLGDRLAGDPARSAFGTGAVTFCSLSPLRSVPHRVVCILGLDQDALPRSVAGGDDLLAAAPALGDRDPRSESRQLLLEAVLSAGDCLVVTTGATDVRTGAPIPPAVVLDELTDAIVETCAGPAAEVLERVRTEHPRQCFDEANFVPGRLGPGAPRGPWSFDAVARGGADAMRSRSHSSPGPLLADPLPAQGGDPVVTLDDLRRFLRKPVETFFTDRLGLRLPRVDETGVDDLPVELSGLDSWSVGDQLLACVVEGERPDAVLAVLAARGVLPPGRLGEDLAERLLAEAEEYSEVAEAVEVSLRADSHRAVELDLGDGRVLRGTVTCSDGTRPGPLTVRFSRTKPHQRLHLAVDLLALTASDPDTEWRGVALHRKARGGPVCTELVVRAATRDERAELSIRTLRALVGLRDRGLCLPLPIFDATSRALYDLGPDPAPHELGPVRKAWTDSLPMECDDPYTRLAFGAMEADDLLELTVDGSTPSELARDLWEAVEAAVCEPEDQP